MQEILQILIEVFYYSDRICCTCTLFSVNHSVVFFLHNIDNIFYVGWNMQGRVDDNGGCNSTNSNKFFHCSNLNLSLEDLVFQNIYAKLVCLKCCRLPTHVLIQRSRWEQHKLGSAQLFSSPLQRYTHVEHTTNSQKLHKNNKPQANQQGLV